MVTDSLNASMLVNRGLQAGHSLDATIELADDTPPDVVLGSFRQFALDPKVQLASPELAGILAGLGSTTDLASWAINAKYAEVGGADGLLGRTLSAVQPAGKGFMRSFASGVIYWHANTGAHALYGPILARWRELGAEGGFLAFPASDVSTGRDVRAEGTFAHFQGGSIYWSPPSSFGSVVGHLGTQVLEQASVLTPKLQAGSEGSTISAGAAVLPATDAQRLARGAIANAAALSLQAELRATTATTSFANGQSAALLNDAASLVPSRGAIHETAIGSISDHIDLGGIVALQPASAGALEVHGAIREKYLALGAEASILGYPRTDESGTPDGRGRFNHFEGGSIYWTADTGAHEVHGLIRNRWSQLGWERNPQLGYPITDELIPDPRIGHRRPEVIKKPIPSLPSGVIKLPAAASEAGFPASVVNTPLASARAAAAEVVQPRTATASISNTQLRAASGSVGAIGALSSSPSAAELRITPGMALDPAGTLLQPGASANASIGIEAITATDGRSDARLEVGIHATLDPSILALLTSPASTAAPERSLNRFADFESGVLFWFRGATSASVLSPLSATRDGTSLAFSGADIAAIAIARLGRAAVEFGNAQLQSTSFLGTTGYSFDGVQVHNRRHRLQVLLQGVEATTVSGPLGIPLPQVGTVTAAVELQVEVWFDAAQRRIALALVDWSLLHASSGSYAAMVSAGLRDRLDALLWRAYEVMQLPDTDGGAPIAVLSVKTLANGAVVVFVEPHRLHLLDGIGDLANAVTLSTIQFTQNP